MTDVTPDPKVKPRGEKRYRRKVASPKQWAAIRAEKLYDQRCRIHEPHSQAQELHHLVPRALGGDDVADNLAGLCRRCHVLVSNRDAAALGVLAESLSDAEYAYCISKLGENALSRLFGVMSETPR